MVKTKIKILHEVMIREHKIMSTRGKSIVQSVTQGLFLRPPFIYTLNKNLKKKFNYVS